MLFGQKGLSSKGKLKLYVELLQFSLASVYSKQSQKKGLRAEISEVYIRGVLY